MAHKGHQSHHGRMVEIPLGQMLSVKEVIGFVGIDFGENGLQQIDDEE